MSADFPQVGQSLHSAPRAVHRPGQPDTFASERPSWGPIKAGPIRTLSQWMYLNSDTRGDAVGALCRRARADGSFPTDPTTVIRYLVTQLAPNEVLETARQAVAEYRAWQREGVEAALREIGHVQPDRAAGVRESLAASLWALDRLYEADAAVLAGPTAEGS